MKTNKEIAIEIIDKFEELLEQHNIIIPDIHREKGNYKEARIYGSGYFTLEDDIIVILDNVKKNPAHYCDCGKCKRDN